MVKRSRTKSRELKEDGGWGGGKSIYIGDVPDSHGLQAFSSVEKRRFSKTPQGLVNHASQGLVNHAGR
jgi:hypothetical protein